MFQIDKYRSSYHHDYVTVIPNILPKNICAELRKRVNDVIDQGFITLVDHQGKGTDTVSDSGGRYLHHIFKGEDVREYLPELTAVYHSLLPLVNMVTCSDVIVSPYPRSDINIKVYPPGGGTLGEHFDTNGITVLLFLTTNREAPLRLQIPRSHPSKKESWIEREQIYADEGSVLIMRGREVLHDCAPTVTEQKMTVVMNFYKRTDTWRPAQFDSFVYDGIDPESGKHSPIAMQEELETL
jgi:hypothetical protein